MFVKHSLLLLLLCVYFQSCDGRQLRANRLNKVNAENDSKKGIPEILDSTSTAETSVERSRNKSKLDVGTEEDLVKKAEITKGYERGKRASSDVVTGADESLRSNVSKAWKLPAKNRRHREEHPSFNQDYMQPATHPPHHN